MKIGTINSNGIRLIVLRNLYGAMKFLVTKITNYYKPVFSFSKRYKHVLLKIGSFYFIIQSDQIQFYPVLTLRRNYLFQCIAFPFQIYRKSEYSLNLFWGNMMIVDACIFLSSTSSHNYVVRIHNTPYYR